MNLIAVEYKEGVVEAEFNDYDPIFKCRNCGKVFQVPMCIVLSYRHKATTFCSGDCEDAWGDLLEAQIEATREDLHDHSLPLWNFVRENSFDKERRERHSKKGIRSFQSVKYKIVGHGKDIPQHVVDMIYLINQIKKEAYKCRHQQKQQTEKI